MAELGFLRPNLDTKLDRSGRLTKLWLCLVCETKASDEGDTIK